MVTCQGAAAPHRHVRVRFGSGDRSGGQASALVLLLDGLGEVDIDQEGRCDRSTPLVEDAVYALIPLEVVRHVAFPAAKRVAHEEVGEPRTRRPAIASDVLEGRCVAAGMRRRGGPEQTRWNHAGAHGRRRSDGQGWLYGYHRFTWHVTWVI